MKKRDHRAAPPKENAPRAPDSADEKNMRVRKDMPVVPPGTNVLAYQSSAATCTATAKTTRKYYWPASAA